MRSYIIGFVLLLGCASLEDAWPFWLRIGGGPPFLVVAAVACIGLVRGAVDGCLAGLVGALLLGGATHTPLGGLFLGFMAVGTLAGLLRGTLFAERLPVAVLIAALGVTVASIVRMIFVPPPEFLPWTKATLGAVVLTAHAAPLVFWLARFTKPPETAL